MKAIAARIERTRARKAADPCPIDVVVEAHAVWAAHSHPRRASDGGEAVGQRRRGVRRQGSGGEEDGRRDAHGRGLRERLLEPLVADREHGEIGSFRKVRKRRQAGKALDLAVVGVDRIGPAKEAALASVMQHVAAGRVRPRARAHEGDDPRRKKRLELLRIQGRATRFGLLQLSCIRFQSDSYLAE